MANNNPQRPDSTDMMNRDVLFHHAGQTGWRRRRDLHGYKGSRKEGDFSDQHDRFHDPAVDPPVEE